MIKAIETVYKGYRFRSRLEARWAVFFDTLDVEWEYEKEGYDLDGLKYLPDFWLPTQRLWVEIKGECPTQEELEKAVRLAKHSKYSVVICWGNIDSEKQSSYMFRVLRDGSTAEMSLDFRWSECPYCGCIDIASGGKFHNLSCQCFAKVSSELISVEPKEGLSLVFQHSRLHRYALAVIRSLPQVNIKLTLIDRNTFHVFDPIQGGHKAFTPLIGGRKKEILDILKKRDEIEESLIQKICNTSPRLIAAYTAARQARFEHGR